MLSPPFTSADAALEPTGHPSDGAWRIRVPAGDSPWVVIAGLETDGPLQSLFVGGSCYHAGGRGVLPDAFSELSLFPFFCWYRIDPIRLPDGSVAVPCTYVGMPLVVIEDHRGAHALVFPTRTKSGHPLGWRIVPKSGGGMRWELGFVRKWAANYKGAEHYEAWDESPLAPGPPLECRDAHVTASVHCYVSTSTDTAIDHYLDHHARPAERDVSVDRHLTHAITSLHRCLNPRSGLLVEWPWNHKQGFKNGLFSLPTFHTLLADGRWLAEVAGAPGQAVDAAVQRSFVRKDASRQTSPGARAWHNSVHWAWGAWRPRFYTHLGTGLAGYPGGQATIVGAAAQRVLADPGAPRSMYRRLQQGANWLVHTQGSDGAWPRTVYLSGDEAIPQETSSDIPSEGATAEAAWALIGAGRALQDRGHIEAGARALRWVSQRLRAGMVMGGYLRDNRADEPDGISAVPVIDALLEARQANLPEGDLDLAEQAGRYLSTWQRWWMRDQPSVDPLLLSFKPRIAPWETTQAARAFLALSGATGNPRWRALATEAFRPLDLELESPGYGEAIYYDESWGLRPHPMGTVYVAAAVVRFLRSWCDSQDQEPPRIEVHSVPYQTPSPLMIRARTILSSMRLSS